MSFQSPFLNSDEQIPFCNSSDYTMALAYIAKYYNEYTAVEDLINVFKEFKINNKYDISILKKYVMNVKYSELTSLENKNIFSFIGIKKINNCDYENSIHKLSVLNNNNMISPINIAYYFDLLYYYNNHYKNICYETVFKYIFKNNKDFNIYQNQKKLIKSIHLINKDYYEDFLEDYFIDNDLIDIFQMLEIEYVKDLFKYNDEILFLLFAINIDEYVVFFDKMSKRKREPIKGVLDIIEEIKQKVFKLQHYQEIFYQRYGILCEKKTLEEIGKKYGVTRELIRQKVDKSTKKIKERYSSKIEHAVYNALKQLKINKDYIEFDDVKKFIDDDEISCLLRVLIEIADFRISFDNNYQIFYYIDRKKEIEESRLVFIPYFISNDELDKYKGLDHSLIVNSIYYKRYRNNGYLKSDYTSKELYSLVIEELFPDGFRKNEETLEIINQEMGKKYGIEKTNLGVLARIIDRGEYCNIDRGLFICAKYAITLSEELKDRLLSFISNNDAEIIYFDTIFTEFKKELNSIGINNKYYLKGVLDRIIPSDYTSQRDFISIGNNFKTAAEIINDYISSINGNFSITSFRKKFPGVADWVFINQINQRNDVLQNEYAGDFYRISYLCITDDFINTLSNEIDNLFISLNSPVITSTKIFSKMSIFHSELMGKYTFLNNHYILYSYIMKNFKTKYFFRRPYISNNEQVNLSCESIISNYVNSLEYFNSKIIDSFCSKMHLRSLYSYLDFVIEKSDKFISINMENCVKKEKIFVDKSILDKIQYELNYYINSFGPINTKNYNDYSSLPCLNYSWTKYLLIGIIRTYLNNLFTIEYTDNFYNTTDFIIRRNVANE